MKLCALPDCGNVHRARGLCSTHYNQQHQPHWHAPALTACVVCETRVLRRPSSADRKPTCSVECRQIVQHSAPAATRYSWAQSAAKRARAAGATVVDLFDRASVFERDGWVCYLCDLPTDRDADPFDPQYPTVDHVVPLSQGGEHTLGNARTAHLGCNSAKQDRPAELVLTGGG